MRHKIKLKSIFTILLLALMIANCGGGSNSDDPTNSGTNPDTNSGEQTGNTDGSSGGSAGGSSGNSGGGSGSGSGGSSSPSSSFTSIDMGSFGGCGLKSDGSVWCWGYGQLGQLGNNAEISQSVPVQVEDNNMGSVASIAVGDYHACGLKTDGTVWCWGDNGDGQLGNSAAGSESNTPVQVDDSSMGAVSRLSLGAYHSCALKNDGSAWCWGGNYNGELGHNSSDANSLVPVQVDDSSMGAVTDLSAGDFHNCALKTDGSAWCWGYNGDGQLGHNSSDAESRTPVQVDDSSMGSLVALSSGGDHSCALKTDGQAWCWGYNYSGQLGHNSISAQSLVPVQVDNTNMGAVTALSLGGDHSCALKSNGDAWCWGDNADGQLGHNSSDTESNTPVQIDNSNMGSVASLSLGGDHSCALKTNGTVWCWGSNVYGQLSQGDFTEGVAFHVDSLGSLASLQAYQQSTYALSAEGNIWVWGRETGILSYSSSETNGPEMIPDLNQVASFAINLDTLCAVKTDQSVWCMGNNNNGELGDGNSPNDSDVPVQVDNTNMSAVTTVVVGSGHACGLETNGDLWCWGDNSSGQLGDNNAPNDSDVPVQVLSGVGQIASKISHSCALLPSSQSVYCWGYNSQGQTGVNTSSSTVSKPQDVGLTGVESVVVGNRHSCALKSDRSVWCWGDNSNGQLGIGTYSNTGTYQPQQVTGLTATAIFADDYANCALDESEQLWCWGSNNEGFGLEEFGRRLTTPTLTELSDVSSVTWGNSHACFIDHQNETYCAGEYDYGQLGSGRLVKSLSPVEIVLE